MTECRVRKDQLCTDKQGIVIKEKKKKLEAKVRDVLRKHSVF